MIEFGQEVCADLAQASSHEWLETNGLGGFASSTLTGLNTRRYHGLLVAAVKPPVGRAVLLSKLEEILVVVETGGEQRVELGTNQYPGVLHPQGFVHLKRFRLEPYPIFTFESGGVIVEKHVCMVRGENTVVVQYKLVASRKAALRLEVRPLIAFRDYHVLTHENVDIRREVEQLRGLACVTPYEGMPTLHLAHNAANVRPDGDWYRSFQYAREQERGLDFQEDLFNPLCFEFELSAGRPAQIIASTEVHDVADAEKMIAAAVERRRALAGSAFERGETAQILTLAADQFIVARGTQKTVIAGYHWFGDWGRDTMISLPGLALATGRHQDAKDILLEFAKYVDQGMLPNRFPDDGETAEYNTVDATLWYFEAVRAHHAATKDKELLARLLPVLRDIIEWHIKGTRYGIRMEPETCLLHAGEPGVQLTWMDAKIGDWVVTPRMGKPVEIQALWYNALCVMAEFAAGAELEQFAELAANAKQSFNRLFWNDDADCLYDVVGETNDASIRPNQIFAVSLHHTMLSDARAGRVVEKVRQELLTPVGLRTLAPADPQYVGRYCGDQRCRDAAYHQGTVWPWLLGPFVEAYIKVNGDTAATRKLVAGWLSGLVEHLREAGLGTVSEIFEGDAPHAPCGCIAQAWSVAEMMRAMRMTVPPKEKTSRVKSARS